MFFVTEFIIEEGAIDRLVGPFDSAVDAMDWADNQALMRTAEDQKLAKEASESVIMVSADDDHDGCRGYVYQVLEPESITKEA